MAKEYLYTFLISITPVLELRASIPLALLKFELSLIEALLISCAGGIAVAALVLLCLPPAIKYTQILCPFTKPLIEKVLSHTRKKHGKKLNVMGDIFLVILVAIPLPGSGAFTGSLVAYLFGIKFWKALWLLSMGIILSALIVSFLTLSGQSLWQLFNEFFQAVPV